MVKRKNIMIGVAIFTLPLLLLHSTAAGQDAYKGGRRHRISTWLGAGILVPPVVTEINGSNLQKRYAPGGSAGIGYGYRLYKNLWACVFAGADIYSFRYRADVATDVPGVQSTDVAIRRTEKFYCFNGGLSLLQQLQLAGNVFQAEAGVKFVKTPSLFLDHGYSVQGYSSSATARVFKSEVDFKGNIVPAYFLKLGMPLFADRAPLWANIVFNYCPGALGNGKFYFDNSTTNSYGTFKLTGSGMGVEIRYTF